MSIIFEMVTGLALCGHHQTLHLLALPTLTIMFFKTYYTTTVLAALGLILALQVQLVYALPLQPVPTTSVAVRPTTQIRHDARPWLNTRARQSPRTTVLLNNHEEDNTASAIPLLSFKF